MDEPEVRGSQPRRARLFGEAIHLGHDRASRQARLEQVMEREASLVKWVSLRGSLMFISMLLEDPSRSFDDLRSLAGGPEPSDLKNLADNYSTISELSLEQVNANPNLVRTPEWHFSAIAWAATAFGNFEGLVLNQPRAQALTTPGWYADPAFAKAERFWDGSDWTPRCRVLDNRRYIAGNNPL